MSSRIPLQDQLRTEQDRTRRRELLLADENEVLRLIIDRAPIRAVLEALTRTAERQSDSGVLASILLLDRDGIHLRHGAAPSLPQAYNDAIDGVSIGPKVGSCGTAAYNKTSVVVTDIADDPLWADFKNLALSHGLRACWSTPILSSKGSVLGTFAMYYTHPCTPDEEDEAVVGILTRTAALALEHETSEANLAESEERFRSLSRCSPLGIFTTDAEGTFMYVNPRFREISGFEYEKSVEYWLDSVVELQARKTAVDGWNASVAARAEFAHDFRLESAHRWVKMRAAAMSSSAGRYLGYVGTVEDISDRVLAEDALRKESAFREAIEESIESGITVVDLEGRLTYVNRAFCDMVGWTSTELVGSLPPFPHWPREDAEHIGDRVMATLRGEEVKSTNELQFRRKSGELFNALVTRSALRGSDGRLFGCVASVIDLTGRKRAAEAG